MQCNYVIIIIIIIIIIIVVVVSVIILQEVNVIKFTHNQKTWDSPQLRVHVSLA